MPEQPVSSKPASPRPPTLPGGTNRGRPGPKDRTRRLLIEAVHELFRTGGPLTVTAVAELAGVSRATAYRYFPSNDVVVLQATLPAGDDPLLDGAPADLPEPTGESLPDRAAALVRRMGEWAFDHQTELRTMMRLSLSPQRGELTALRRGHTNRDRWIASLLDGLPDDVPEASRRRLAAALTPLFGADAVIWTTDIAALSRQEALDVLEWAARTLVEAALAGK